MWGKHKGSGTGKPDQGAGKRRGIETANGRTASTGRTDGNPPTVTSQGEAPDSAGRRSVLRTIWDVLK